MRGSPGTWRGEARSRGKGSRGVTAPGASHGARGVSGEACGVRAQGQTTQDLAESDRRGLSGRWLVSR